MQKFINTRAELFLGDEYFKHHVMLPDFNWRTHKRELSTYWAEKGFSVSMMYNDYFSRRNLNVSDRYMSMDIFYFYVLPCLNSYELRPAYADKNFYTRIFPGANIVRSVIKNRNGLFYDGADNPISRDDAIGLCMSEKSQCMIKPTLLSCDGVGVELFDASSRDTVASLFEKYNVNFAVQNKVVQHSVMGRLNPTSVNTLRMFTYRSLVDGVILLPYTMVRFGGKGTYIDNARAGGGFCQVDEEGHVSDRLYKLYEWQLHSLKKDLGIDKLTIPNYNKAVEFVKHLHSYLPYFDFIGWDIAIDKNGEPTMIEFNVDPSIELQQVGYGPVFGNYLDEVVERIKTVDHKSIKIIRNTFRKGFTYVLPIDGGN